LTHCQVAREGWFAVCKNRTFSSDPPRPYRPKMRDRNREPTDSIRRFCAKMNLSVWRSRPVGTSYRIHRRTVLP